MYARAALTGTQPTLDVDRTLGADDAPRSAYAYEELRRGDSVGRYLVLRPLGRGGMGAVYAAHDPELDRTIALKIVHHAGSRAASLKEEAQTLAQLSHRNVVAVHDVGDLPDGVFIAMEYVEGQTLRLWAAAHRADPAAVAAVMRDAGEGLAAAHRAGLVHLDFKPDNVMIAQDGRVLVLDFGLAKSKKVGKTGTDVPPSGTPAYMAPEMHRREPIDERADQFSFCVTCFEAILGQRPFPGDSPSSIARAIVEGDLMLPPRPPKVSRTQWQALLRGLSADPQLRWPSMRALLEALEPPRRSRRNIVGAALLAGSLGAAGMWALAVPERRCGTASAKVGAAWSEADATALRERAAAADDVLASPRSELLIDRLDAHAASLVEAYEEACRYDAENVARRLCLDSRLELLRATRDFVVAAEGLPSADEPGFDVLEDIERCVRADEDALFREVSDPARARALLAGLAEGEVLLSRGKIAEAVELLEPVVSEAEALGWDATASLAHAHLSKAAATRGDKETMQAEYERALELATTAGSNEATYFALSGRLQEYALAGATEAVRALAPAVDIAAQQAGRPGAITSMALGNALQLNADYAGAEAAYEQARNSASDPETALNIVSNLGALKLYRGKYGEAKAMFAASLPEAAALRGASSIMALKMQANLADALQQLGELSAARERYEDAVAKYEAAGLEDSRPAVHLRLNYATMLLAAGDLETAVQIGGPAASTLLELYGPQHVYSLAARDFQITVDLAHGRHAEAFERIEALLEDAAAMFGTEVPLLGFLRLSLASAALETDRSEVGLGALRKAEPLLVELNPAHPYLVKLHTLRAELLLLGQASELALESAEEAVRRAAGDSVHPVDAGRAHLLRAEAQLAMGAELGVVTDDLERAAALFDALPRHPDADTARVRALLDGG